MTEPGERRGPHLEPGWAGPATTVLVAVAYLLGYLETAFFASALGLTARDLGLDLKDYAVLALLNVAVVAVAAAGLWLATQLDAGAPRMRRWIDAGVTDRSRSRRRAVAEVASVTAFVAGLAVGAVGLGLDPADLGMAVVGVAAAALFGIELVAKRRREAATVVSLFVAVVGLFGLACYSAHVYARGVRADIRAADEVRLPPLPLRSLLQPETGLATRDGVTTCAVRVSKGVLLGRDAVTVTETDRFTVTRCKVADVPFG